MIDLLNFQNHLTNSDWRHCNKICYIDLYWYSMMFSYFHIFSICGSVWQWVKKQESWILHYQCRSIKKSHLFQGVTATTNKPATVPSSFPTWKLGTHFERSKLAEPVQLPVAAEVRGVDTSRKSSSLGKVKQHKMTYWLCALCALNTNDRSSLSDFQGNGPNKIWPTKKGAGSRSIQAACMPLAHQ